MRVIKKREKIYSTTEEDFEFFQKEFFFWVAVWGLHDWELFFTHEYLEDARACIYIDEVGRIARVSLTTDWSQSFSREELSRVAFHEARELLLGVLTKAAFNRSVTESQLLEATHTIIRIDENTIWRPYWNAKHGNKKRRKTRGKYEMLTVRE